MGEREMEHNTSTADARGLIKRNADHPSERSCLVSGNIPDDRTVEFGLETQELHGLLRDGFS